MNAPHRTRGTTPSLPLAVGLLVLALTVSVRVGAAPAPAPDDGKLRIICFGAHPDDCEIQAGGTAALWAAEGHRVKFVSLTNGDIGHWGQAGGPLAQRRTEENVAMGSNIYNRHFARAEAVAIERQ